MTAEYPIIRTQSEPKEPDLAIVIAAQSLSALTSPDIQQSIASPYAHTADRLAEKAGVNLPAPVAGAYATIREQWYSQPESRGGPFDGMTDQQALLELLAFFAVKTGGLRLMTDVLQLNEFYRIRQSPDLPRLPYVLAAGVDLMKNTSPDSMEIPGLTERAL